ncbi:HAMP domain-containing histidine kinase [Paenibacillus sp. N1-5-1-14]|uniref:sensor histidine kinase n=1 Tax=Paenibacillus radicibacter TaxID=2972488 RepID=UPI002158A9F2|nr:HAMP domain-containing sensor histidine kinase [Paenibacillus radicibacter]MCR8644254.1 HAMP domain-containing histidine kinase [Paenibacillus radicibacter]
MNRLARKGITFKIGLITSGLLIVSTVIVFVIVALMLPSFYQKYKINTLNTALERLIQDSSTKSLQEAKRELDSFTQIHNVWLGVRDLNGNMIYVPSPYVKYKDEPSTGEPKTVPYTKKIEIAMPSNVYSVDKPIAFTDGHYKLFANATLQPIDEVSQVILLFAPYAIGIVILISITGAVIYSRMLTKPLVRVNRVAKRMASLDFSLSSDIRSKDEIGELSRSLNRLSENLQDAMSELQHTNGQLQIEMDKVKKMEDQRKIFITAVSHELKTPITAVMGQIEGMIDQIGIFKDRDKYLRRSYTIMQEMEKLVRELLQIYEFENTILKASLKPIELSPLVKECLRPLDYVIQAKCTQIHVEMKDDVYVQADRNLLKKALSNILQNAIQYSPERATVTVELIEQDTRYVLQITNSEAVIHNSQLQDLFEPFYRIEKSRNRYTGGSGLGLYIVKQIMDVHMLEYGIASTEQGVQFTIYFPREASSR